MKNKLVSIMVTVLLAVTVAGCGATPTDTESVSQETPVPAQAEETPVEKENATENENPSMKTEVTEQVDFTFADLAKYRFEFSSGAGGWAEEFTIEKDGYFTGLFHDSDMGDTGDGYEDGTFYSCSYSGHFTDLTKINEYTYKMRLADITYKEETGTEEIKDNVRYIYTKSSCLGGTDTFTVYLPGTPLSELSEDVLRWILVMNESETELMMPAIADETNGYGMYSYDRFEPLEDAQMAFYTYKNSYDYYSDKLTGAMTTVEMVEYSALMYEVSDECLNYIWNLIRYNVAEEKYNEILTEQRAWISEKEAKAKETASEYEGGSLKPVIYNNTLATLTIKRCEELVEYLK